MSEIASQITSLTIVYPTVLSGADQSKHQSSASLAFVWEIHRWPVNFPHKWPVTRKIFPFDDVIMPLDQNSGIPVNSKLHKICYMYTLYRKISNIRRTKSQNLNDSRLVLQLSLPNPLKTGREWRCRWSSADRRCSNYIWEIDTVIAY